MSPINVPQILTILILNAVVGVSQESSAEKAIAALQEYSANEAKVIRDGQLPEFEAEELVPGDIITIAVGDRIPADCRLLAIQSNSFAVDQAILTGESESVGKDTVRCQGSEGCEAGPDQHAVLRNDRGHGPCYSYCGPYWILYGYWRHSREHCRSNF